MRLPLPHKRFGIDQSFDRLANLVHQLSLAGNHERLRFIAVSDFCFHLIGIFLPLLFPLGNVGQRGQRLRLSAQPLAQLPQGSVERRNGFIEGLQKLRLFGNYIGAQSGLQVDHQHLQPGRAVDNLIGLLDPLIYRQQHRNLPNEHPADQKRQRQRQRDRAAQ